MVNNPLKNTINTQQNDKEKKRAVKKPSDHSNVDTVCLHQLCNLRLQSQHIYLFRTLYNKLFKANRFTVLNISMLF